MFPSTGTTQPGDHTVGVSPEIPEGSKRINRHLVPTHHGLECDYFSQPVRKGGTLSTL